jgi:hypothetical protein
MIHLQRVADGLVTLGLLAVVGLELYIAWALLWPITTEDLLGVITILETVGPWAAGIGVVLLWAYALGWRSDD